MHILLYPYFGFHCHSFHHHLDHCRDYSVYIEPITLQLYPSLPWLWTLFLFPSWLLFNLCVTPTIKISPVLLLLSPLYLHCQYLHICYSCFAVLVPKHIHDIPPKWGILYYNSPILIYFHGLLRHGNILYVLLNSENLVKASHLILYRF